MSSIPESLLGRLSEHLAAQMGWHFPRERWNDLEAGVEAAARELGIDTKHCARDLLTAHLTQRQVEALANAFTVGETYFFRDPRSLAALEQVVLPELILARRATSRRLRIWSAGCCTGEEAYSLAILLDCLLPDIAQWQITLLATDINSRFLQKAAEGIFSNWSFRDAPSWLRERYFQPFTQPGGTARFAVLPRIRRMVTFAHLNLCEDVYPSLTNNTNAMDLILCRNVLMYFSDDRAAHVAHNLHRALVSQGFLLVSAVEASSRIGAHFDLLSVDGALLYRKRSDSDTAPPPATIVQAEQAIAPSSPEFQDEPLQSESHPPQVAVDLRARASALFEQGDYLEAAKLLLADPHADVDRAQLLTRIYANLGDLCAAREWAGRAIDIDRTNALSHYLLAIILQEQNQVAAAGTALQRTLYLEPDFVLAHFALGNLEQQQGRNHAASRHFANALSLLRRFDDDQVLPHSDGLAAGQLREMIRSIASADAA